MSRQELQGLKPSPDFRTRTLRLRHHSHDVLVSYWISTLLLLATAAAIKNNGINGHASFIRFHRGRSRSRHNFLRPAMQVTNHEQIFTTIKSNYSIKKPQKTEFNKSNTYNTKNNDEILRITRMKEAEFVEQTLYNALEHASTRTIQSPKWHTSPQLFPSIRQCNAAIATFGDDGDFRRALKLFTQMRKSVSINRQIYRGGGIFSSRDNNDDVLSGLDKENVCQNIDHDASTFFTDLVSDPPAPTLVSYSTLMSRAVSLGKPRVAIRLCNLMKNQPNFYANIISRKQRDGRTSKLTNMVNADTLRKLEAEEAAIVPDVIFCNTLMNAYAKLGDHTTARWILNSMLGSTASGTIELQEEIPPITPTVVTYNTLADACKEAGDLGAALEVLELMSSHSQITGERPVTPDARTYTILISTVARKTKHGQERRDVRSGGERDPDKAFDLLHRMISEGIIPNGVTYCALIDVCSRCGRFDLALNGLRIMLRRKAESNLFQNRPLFNEVGAWTAAINACGKAGRLDTAMRLFSAMQKFSVKPNAVTCGCLSDNLMKAGRIGDTLDVLKYMKEEGMAPGEVMYTSLMSSALSIAKKENTNIITTGGVQVKVIDKLVTLDRNSANNGCNTTNSIVLYTELMRCMIQESGQSDSGQEVLLKVFLVFQEMKAAGVTPDLACYNSLLRACSFAGDVTKALDVLHRMDEDGIEANDVSWLEALKAAAKEGRSDVADDIWSAAVSYRKKGLHGGGFKPRASDIELLLSAYLRDAQKTCNHAERLIIHRKTIDLFEGVESKSEDRGLCHVAVEELEQNQVFMLNILRAAVSVAVTNEVVDDDERARAKQLACDIVGLDALQGPIQSGVDGKTKKSLGLARNWAFSY